MNASVPNLSTTNPASVTLSNLLSTAQSSPNLTSPSALHVAHVALMDDESMPMEESRSLSEIPLSDQQQKQNDETSEDEDIDDDEHCQMKRPKCDTDPISSNVDHQGSFHRKLFFVSSIESIFQMKKMRMKTMKMKKNPMMTKENKTK